MPTEAKITGERVSSPAGGFNPTWQRHVAAYALAEPYLGPGRVLDLGCGVGHSYGRLAPRETVGVDVDPGALEGQDRQTVVADMRVAAVRGRQLRLDRRDPVDRARARPRARAGGGVAGAAARRRRGLRHPEPHDARAAPTRSSTPTTTRSSRRGSSTPPAAAAFGEVSVRGIFGSDRYMELFNEERATLDRILRLDPLRARRLVPLRAKQRLYDLMLRRYRPEEDPRAEAITPDDFFLGDEGLSRCLDVFAVCRAPR